MAQREGPKAQVEGLAKYRDQLVELDASIALGGRATNRMSPMEVAKAYQDISDKVSRDTGFSAPVFGTMDQVGRAHTVTEGLVAAYNKQADRLYSENQRQLGWDHDKAVEDAKEAAKISLATNVWTVGNPVAGIAGGADKELIEAKANNDWQQGNLTNIVRNFSGGYVPSSVAASAQSSVQSTAREQYSKAFQGSYDKWKTVVAAKPSLALALYGSYHPIMQNYDSMIKSGADPIIAYAKAFGDAAQYSSIDIGPDRRKEVDKGMDKALDAGNSILPWGPASLGPLGRNALKQAAWHYVAVAGKNTDIPTANLLRDFRQAETANGGFESYGQFGWRNAAGTKPLGQMLGLQDRDITEVFKQVYNKHVTALGACANTEPEYLNRYDNNGHPAMVSEVIDSRGNKHRFAITYDELGMAAHDYVAGKVANVRPDTRLDPSLNAGMPAMR